jgi:hypothetical protein
VAAAPRQKRVKVEGRSVRVATKLAPLAPAAMPPLPMPQLLPPREHLEVALAAQRTQCRAMRAINQELAREVRAAQRSVARFESVAQREVALRRAADDVARCAHRELTAAERHRGLELSALVAKNVNFAAVLEAERSLRRTADIAIAAATKEIDGLRRALRDANAAAADAALTLQSAVAQKATQTDAGAEVVEAPHAALPVATTPTEAWLQGCMFELIDVMATFGMKRGDPLPGGIAFLAAILRHDKARGGTLVLKILNSCEEFWRAFELMAPERAVAP